MQPSSAQAQFWQWFRSNADRLKGMMYGDDPDAREDATAELREAVDAVEPGLILEFGQGGEGEPDQLVVSADRKPERVDAVKAFVASAPAIPGWTVVAFRPRMEVGDAIEIVLQGERISPDDVWFRVEEDQSGLNLTLHVRGLTPANERLRGMGASLMAEHTMGEQDAVTLVSSVEIKPLPKNPAAAKLHPLRDLLTVIDAARERKYPPPGSLLLDTESDWHAGSGTISGSPAILLLHGGLQPVAGHPAYDRRLIVSIAFNQVNDAGLPATNEEFEAVSGLGDQIRDALRTDQESLLALVITTQGRRDLIFYTSNADSALKRLEPWQTGQTHEVTTDLEWDTFWDLYRSFCQAASESEDESEE